MGGTKDRIEGNVDELKGEAKQGIGRATDNPDLEAEGEGDELKGKGKQAWGHVKDAGEKVKDAVKDATD
jgi:uncharacterized protein YjbJ (UPF0337 family)